MIICNVCMSTYTGWKIQTSEAVTMPRNRRLEKSGWISSCIRSSWSWADLSPVRHFQTRHTPCMSYSRPRCSLFVSMSCNVLRDFNNNYCFDDVSSAFIFICKLGLVLNYGIEARKLNRLYSALVATNIQGTSIIHSRHYMYWTLGRLSFQHIMLEWHDASQTSYIVFIFVWYIYIYVSACEDVFHVYLQ